MGSSSRRSLLDGKHTDPLTACTIRHQCVPHSNRAGALPQPQSVKNDLKARPLSRKAFLTKSVFFFNYFPTIFFVSHTISITPSSCTIRGHKHGSPPPPPTPVFLSRTCLGTTVQKLANVTAYGCRAQRNALSRFPFRHEHESDKTPQKAALLAPWTAPARQKKKHKNVMLANQRSKYSHRNVPKQHRLLERGGQVKHEQLQNVRAQHGHGSQVILPVHQRHTAQTGGD